MQSFVFTAFKGGKLEPIYRQYERFGMPLEVPLELIVAKNDLAGYRVMFTDAGSVKINAPELELIGYKKRNYGSYVLSENGHSVGNYFL